jgi:hypothetical protein
MAFDISSLSQPLHCRRTFVSDAFSGNDSILLTVIYSSSEKVKMALPPLSPLPPLGGFHPTCKVCDQGELIAKKVFRMSGPTVAIGYILLIPSILGMAGSLLLLFGVISYQASRSTNEPAEILPQAAPVKFPTDHPGQRLCLYVMLDSSVPLLASEQACECSLALGVMAADTAGVCATRAQSGLLPPPAIETQKVYSRLLEDYKKLNNTYRRNCMYSFKANSAYPELIADPELEERYCECALTVMKKTTGRDHPDPAYIACARQLRDGSLAQIDSETRLIYADLLPSPQGSISSSTGMVPSFLRIIGSGFAIVLGIASFVSGLLGYLLVMKKRVLQCSVCGATVSAS